MYPYKREAEGDLNTQKRRRCEDGAERDLKMLALRIGVVQQQAKECWQPPEAGRVKEQIPPIELPEGVWPC